MENMQIRTTLRNIFNIAKIIKNGYNNPNGSTINNK